MTEKWTGVHTFSTALPEQSRMCLVTYSTVPQLAALPATVKVLRCEYCHSTHVRTECSSCGAPATKEAT